MTVHVLRAGVRMLRLAAIASTTLLAGCVAAAPAIMMGMTALTVGSTAFFGYKMYQSSSGSDVQIGFENDFVTQSVQGELAEADTVAFWPSPNRSLVIAAEQVNAQLGLSVLSPAATADRLREAGISTSIETMITTERADTLRRAAEALDADFVVTLTMVGTETDSNLFSLRRSTYTANYDVVLFSRTSDAEVWTSRLIAELGVGGNIPSQSEIDEVAGRAVGDRIIDFAAGDFIVSYLEGQAPEVVLVQYPAHQALILP